MTGIGVWFVNNTAVILGALLFLYLSAFNKFPNVKSVQDFVNIFESKGGQLMLLWTSDMIVMTVLVHYWHFFDAQLQTTIVGLLSGVNGAFLGAIGARNTATSTATINTSTPPPAQSPAPGTPPSAGGPAAAAATAPITVAAESSTGQPVAAPETISTPGTKAGPLGLAMPTGDKP